MGLSSVWVLNCVQFFVTPLTVAPQAPLSMGFPRHEYWRRLPFSTPDLPNPGIKPASLVSLPLAGGFFTTAPLGKPGPHKYSYVSCDVHLCLSSVSSFLLPMFRTHSGILWHQMQIVMIIRETGLENVESFLLPVQVRCTMLDAWGWCTGTAQRDGMGREEGGRFGMGNTCIPVADSF